MFFNIINGFYTFYIFYIFKQIVFMKIFSSFDSNFREEVYKKNIQKYWENNVYLITHGKFYYYFYILLPRIFFSMWIIFYLIIFFFLWNSISPEFKTAYIIFWLSIIIILWFSLWLKLFKKYVDYILDFIVITPKTLIHYDQDKTHLISSGK